MTTTALPSIATFTPKIFWATGTDIPSTPYDDVRRYYLNNPGLQVSGIGRAQVRAYGPPGAPAFDLTLTNEGGEFAPGGPIGGFVGRGPLVTLDASLGVDVLGNATDVLGDDPNVLGDGYQVKRLFTGNVDTVDQSISRGQRQVQIRAQGSISLLNDKSPSTILYENIRTDQAIAVVLDAVGWGALARSLSVGSTTLQYFWLNGSQTALGVINLLLAAEGAGSCAYEDQNGTFHFEGRQFRASNPHSAVVQYTFFDGVNSRNATGDDPTVLGDDPNVLGDGPIEDPLFSVVPATMASNPDEVVARVSAEIKVRTPTSTQKVWEYGGPLTLAANEVRDLYPTSSDPFKSAVTPVAATDYTVSAGSLVGVSLLQTSGQTVTLRLTAGPGGATVIGVTSNGIQLRAVSLPATTTTTVRSTIDTTYSSPRSRPHDVTLSWWGEIAPNTALDIVNSFVQRYQRERRQMTIQVVNIDSAHLRAMLALAISDRIRIVHTFAGIDSDWFIEQITYDISPGGGLMKVTLGCETTFDQIGDRYGTGRYGLSTYAA